MAYEKLSITDLFYKDKKRLSPDRQTLLPVSSPIGAGDITRKGLFTAFEHKQIIQTLNILLKDNNNPAATSNGLFVDPENGDFDPSRENDILQILTYHRQNLYTCIATQDNINHKTIYTLDTTPYIPRENRFNAITFYNILIPANNDYEDVRLLIPDVGNVEKSIKKTDGTNFAINELKTGAILTIVYIPSLDYYKCVEFKNILNATESTAGILPLANNTEALAGTNNTKAMTPLKVQQKIDSLGGLNYNYNDFPLTAFNTTTNLTFNAGKYLNSSNAIITAPAINKSISSAFTAGNNNGGLFPSVSLTANSWLYCFRIKNTISGDVEAGFDNAVDSNLNPVNLPSGYDSPKFVGLISINASSQISPFIVNRIGSVCRTLFRTNAMVNITGSGTSPRTISTGFATNKISVLTNIVCGTNGGGGFTLYDDRGITFVGGQQYRGGAASGAGALNQPPITTINNAGQFIIAFDSGITSLAIFLAGFEFNL